uniref:Uncharacterized protein n=1 Tax=Chrysotila carterae TaxID=13221 RepID=A0A7S4BYA8_CHRCT
MRPHMPPFSVDLKPSQQQRELVTPEHRVKTQRIRIRSSSACAVRGAACRRCKCGGVASRLETGVVSVTTSHVCAVHEWRRVAPREAHQPDGRLDNAHACAVQTATQNCHPLFTMISSANATQLVTAQSVRQRQNAGLNGREATAVLQMICPWAVMPSGPSDPQKL